MHNAIVILTKAGHHNTTICGKVRINPITLNRWLDWGKRQMEFGEESIYTEFYHDVMEARSDAIIRATEAVTDAFDKNPEIALKYLQMRWPEMFSPRKSVVEISGPDKQPIQIQTTNNIAILTTALRDQFLATGLLTQEQFDMIQKRIAPGTDPNNPPESEQVLDTEFVEPTPKSPDDNESYQDR